MVDRTQMAVMRTLRDAQRSYDQAVSANRPVDIAEADAQLEAAWDNALVEFRIQYPPTNIWQHYRLVRFLDVVHRLTYGVPE